MQSIAKTFPLGVAILITVTGGASALETRFDRPMYQNLARLDNCQLLGGSCEQPAADDFCQMKGYEGASNFETEHTSPTRVMEFANECTGSVCVAFKSIVCFTRARAPAPVRDCPHTY
jgi:hypothetical protein